MILIVFVPYTQIVKERDNRLSMLTDKSHHSYKHLWT